MLQNPTKTKEPVKPVLAMAALWRCRGSMSPRYSEGSLSDLFQKLQCNHCIDSLWWLQPHITVATICQAVTAGNSSLLLNVMKGGITATFRDREIDLYVIIET